MPSFHDQASNGQGNSMWIFGRLPESIGGSLPGVHYIREVADADALVTTLVKFLQTKLSLIKVMRCCCSPIYCTCMHIVVMCHVCIL
jgi:hypothetical protein